MKASDVKALAQELRPHIEAEIDRAEIIKGMATAAREKGIDWSELKKLVKAQVLDAREGTDKRVAAIIEKADFASAYADMLGFASKMNEKEKTCSSSAPAPKATDKPAGAIEPAPAVMRPAAEIPAPVRAIPDDLSIPDFLVRSA